MIDQFTIAKIISRHFVPGCRHKSYLEVMLKSIVKVSAVLVVGSASALRSARRMTPGEQFMMQSSPGSGPHWNDLDLHTLAQQSEKDSSGSDEGQHECQRHQISDPRGQKQFDQLRQQQTHPNCCTLS